MAIERNRISELMSQMMRFSFNLHILFGHKSVKSSGNLTTLTTQPAFTCSKLTIETLEQGVKYVQS